MDYKIFWSAESLKNLEYILAYLETEWTHREITKFKIKLSKQIQLIAKNPKLFPVSDYNPKLRKAVLSKQTTIFYELRDNMIFIAYLFSNKMDINRIR